MLSSSIWRRQTRDGRPPEVYDSHLKAAEGEDLPYPAEQLDRLILFLGEQQGSPGKDVERDNGCLRAKLGALNVNDERFIVSSGVSEGLFDNTGTLERHDLRLTMAGWHKFRELKRGSITSRTAFMAMSFHIPELSRIADEYFRSAVEKTGFRLKRLDDEPAAGSIDNRLRVEIRMCRFLIADLTDKNSGAYWEAGYAEGLGKPVIYTCEKTFFDREGTHFDTSHHQTVLWDPGDPEKAAEKLADTIRATLPFEATMPQDSL